MRLPAAVHHHGHQVVHAVQVDGVSGRVEEAQLQREDDAVGQLGVALQLLHVLEPLQVQRQDHGQPLHTHPGAARWNVMDEVGANCYSTPCETANGQGVLPTPRVCEYDYMTPCCDLWLAASVREF